LLSETIIPLKKLELLKTRALRNKVWFMATEKIERALVSTSLQRLQFVRRGSELAKILASIASRIEKALRQGKQFIFERIGTPLARAMVRIAKSWGYSEAENWLKDPNYARFLGLNAYSIRISSGWGKETN
jgi:hypothetical protein